MTSPAPMPETKYRRLKITPLPERRETAQERGQALRHWLDAHNFLVEDFVEVSGITRTRFKLFLAGRMDLADMPQDEVQRLLETMLVPDQWAWEYFGIPDEKRVNFHTFRPDPWGGHAGMPTSVRSLQLEGPLHGELTAPAGVFAFYDPASREGYLLTRAVGRLMAVSAGTEGDAEVLGRLLRLELAPPQSAASRVQDPQQN